MRARCGTTSPIQPTMPQMETEAAVMRVAQTITVKRITRVFIPRVRASCSPMHSTLSRQRNRSKGMQPAAMGMLAIHTSRMVMEAKLPSSQKVMAGSLFNGSAMYLVREMRAVNMDPMRMPTNTSMSTGSPRRQSPEASAHASSTATSPPAKERA